MNTTPNAYVDSLVKNLFLSISLIVASTILGSYLYKSRQAPRSVVVKGLAEREVTANIGVWPICFRVADDDLVVLQQKMETQRHMITNFLLKYGFTPDEITYGIPEINDKEAASYRSERRFRYTKQLVITVRSKHVNMVENAMQISEELASKGIIMDTERWEYRYKFIFTELNELKPSMIQQATIEARKAAEQFAKDSGVKVGSIRHATQGTFSIEDTHIPTKKQVRVITNVEYALVD
eukprot:gene203-267_t